MCDFGFASPKEPVVGAEAKRDSSCIIIGRAHVRKARVEQDQAEPPGNNVIWYTSN